MDENDAWNVIDRSIGLLYVEWRKYIKMHTYRRQKLPRIRT